MSNTTKLSSYSLATGTNFTMDVIDKEIKVVVKQYANGIFAKSTIVPTSKHPLPKNEYEVFTCENTETITDPKLLELIDSVKFKAGMCYNIAETLYDLLKKNGYSPVTYEGWLFMAESKRPIHHCVTRVGNSIIDNGYNEAMLKEYEKRMIEKGLPTGDDARYILAELIEEYAKMKNSEANPSIGKLASSVAFIGCENSPESARVNFNALMDRYPDHEDYNGTSVTRVGNRLNEILKERGYYK